MIDCQLD